jgi:hypothetical protein
MQRCRVGRILAVAVSLLASSHARAYFSLEEAIRFHAAAESRNMVEVYVGGIMEGLWVANSASKTAVNRPLSACPRVNRCSRRSWGNSGC